MSRMLAHQMDVLRHKAQTTVPQEDGDTTPASDKKAGAAEGYPSEAPQSSAGGHEQDASSKPRTALQSMVGKATSGGTIDSHGMTMMMAHAALPWGLASTEQERDKLGAKALMPRRIVDREAEVARALAAVRASGGGLAGHRTLMAMRSFSPSVFHALLQQNVEELLPLVYTPTVGDACLSWGTLYPRPPGLYITLEDRGRVAEVLQQWPHPAPKIAIVTDGERILGLGDLGAHGMGIPTGKRSVYAGCGVPPQWVVPVGLDVGCSRDDIRDDPNYVGLPRKRATGEEYWSFMLEEVVPEMRKVWGQGLVVHWEDVGRCSAYRLLEDLRAHQIPTFDDDIECTAVAILAALMAAGRVEGGPELKDQRFLLFGAGQANIGAARLLKGALRKDGVPEEEIPQKLWLVDSHGLVTTKRENLSSEKKEFAREPPAGTSDEGLKQLKDIILAAKPTTLIGAAAVGGAFDKEVIQALLEVSQQQEGKATRPVVLALSNPTEKAECTFEQAMEWSDGHVIYASGTRFPSMEVDTAKGKRTIEPGQVNNCFMFPGIGLGAVVSGGARITDEGFLAAAAALAGTVTDEDVSRDTLTPRINQLHEVALKVATAVAAAAFRSTAQPGSESATSSSNGGAGKGENAAETGAGAAVDADPVRSQALSAFQAGGDAQLKEFIRSIMYDAMSS